MNGHVDRPALREHVLGTPASARVAAHLAACETCRLVLEAERALARRIEEEMASAFAVEPGPGFDARVRAGLHGAGTNAARPALLHWLAAGPHRWPALAAAATVALGIAVVMLAPRSPRAPIPPAEARREARGQAPEGAAVPSRTRSAEGAGAAPRPAGAHAGADAAGATEQGTNGTRRAITRPLPPRRRSAPKALVLVPPQEAVALARFVAGRDRWRLAETVDGPAEKPAPIAIAPLAIEPLELDD